MLRPSSLRLSLLAAVVSLSALQACGGDEFAPGDEPSPAGGSGGSGQAGSGGSAQGGKSGTGGTGGQGGTAGQAGQGAQGGASGQGGGGSGQGASSGQSGQAGASGEGGSAGAGQGGTGGSSGQQAGGSAGQAQGGSAGQAQGGSGGSSGNQTGGSAGEAGSSGQGAGGSGGSSGNQAGGSGGAAGSGQGGSGGSAGSGITCGDNVCSSPVEACDNCPLDCGPCGPKCGNGACEPGETCSTCPGDCGACGPTCGNQQCEAGETCMTCAADCGGCGPVAMACQDYANAACARWDQCSSFLMKTQFGSVSDCVARLSARCQAEFSLSGVSTKAAIVLADCAGKAPFVSCDTMVSPGVYDVCGSSFGGQLQNNQGCQSHAQCSSGYCAIASSGCGLCSPPPQHGVTMCPQSRDCGGGMVCGADNLCYQRGIEEKPCGNAPCLPSLECNFDQHACAKPLALGQGCDPGNDLCSKAQGLFCDSEGGSVCTVIPVSGPNGVCGGTSSSVCLGGTHCGFNDSGACTPNAADGASCSQQNPCLPYASCIAYGTPDATCQMPQPNKLCASSGTSGG